MPTGFRQARWEEPLLKELSRRGRVGTMVHIEEKAWEEFPDPASLIPPKMRRESLNLPELSELQVLRHFNRLSQMNFSVELGMYPLGSCTMKYNPKVSEYIAGADGMKNAHPMQPEETVQGLLGMFYELERALSEVTGMERFSLSKSPSVLGTVNIIPAVLGEMRSATVFALTSPVESEGTFTILNPAMAALAGLVP